MKLSKYFSLSEFTHSDTARTLDINNQPSQQELINLAHLCINVLDPCRAFFNKPMSISSGYRSLELNRAVRSKDTSQHINGQAGDVHIKGVDNMVLAEFIRDNLCFDQLIAEKLDKNDGAKGWVHVSYNFLGTNRKNVLSYTGDRYLNGLIF